MAVVGLCSACLSSPSEDLTTTRYIDTICATDRYLLEGSARRTTGLTEDACGFVIGPDAGKITFEIPEFDLHPQGNETTEVSVLVRSTADDSMGWLPLSVDTQAAASMTSSTSSTYYSFTSTGTEVEIIDVRIHASPNDFANCD